MPSFDLDRADDEIVDGTRLRAETGRMGEAQSLLLLSTNYKQEIDSLEEESYHYDKMRNRTRGLLKEQETDDGSLLGLLNEEQSAIDDGSGSLYDELNEETLVVDDDKKKDLERIQLQLEIGKLNLNFGSEGQISHHVDHCKNPQRTPSKGILTHGNQHVSATISRQYPWSERLSILGMGHYLMRSSWSSGCI